VFTKTGNTGQIIAGTVGAQSTLENIAMCREAASVGADFALVLPPSYYPSLMTDEAIKEFYKDVSQPSAFDLVHHSL
jgi:dihydrodipicolinate synthase/N-acetylneuraminate lyase